MAQALAGGRPVHAHPALLADAKPAPCPISISSTAPSKACWTLQACSKHVPRETHMLQQPVAACLQSLEHVHHLMAAGQTPAAMLTCSCCRCTSENWSGPSRAVMTPMRGTSAEPAGSLSSSSALARAPAALHAVHLTSASESRDRRVTASRTRVNSWCCSSLQHQAQPSLATHTI